MLTGVPYLPESAPFSSEQREWLNGFLAGLFSNVPLKTAPIVAEEPVKVGVYFATQSGTAERLAKKLSKELKGLGYAVEVSSLEKVTPPELVQQENALLLVSSYGEGDPPESATSLREVLFAPDAPPMTRLRY